MNIKRLLLALCLIGMACLMGCTAENGTVNRPKECRIVCTVFPAYDWTRVLLDGVESAVTVQYLLDDGSDVHSFQPGAADYVAIAESDVFIFAGGSSNMWVQDALNNSPKQDRIVIDLMEADGIMLLESFASEHEQEEHEADEVHSHEEEIYDEHIWMSLDNASAAVDAIADAISSRMPGEAKRIDDNRKSYQTMLENLDANYRDMTKGSSYDYLLVPDRFPFLYLTESYGLSFDAAFEGCQTEAEADFEMIIRLARLVEEKNVPALIVTEVSDKKLAETVRENVAGCECNILVLDSMQAVTSGMVEEGKTYLGTMESNFEVLRKALGNE